MDDQRRDRLWREIARHAGDRHLAGWVAVVCGVAVSQVDVDAAAISVRGGARTQELVAASDDWARQLEELQYTLGEGPGAEAHASGGPVLVADLSGAGDRWPGFTGGATEAGAAAAFAFPLHGGAIRLGTLSLFRRRPGPLSAGSLADAAALADLATTALLADLDGAEPVAWAREDATSYYEDVSVATGMLAAQLHIRLEDALSRLRAHAYSEDRRLLDVARAVLSRTLRLDGSE